MTWWESLLLGLIQGLTEFLPVSSSGHLVLAQHILGIAPGEDGVLFEVMVHFGTLLSIVFVYRARIGSLLAGFLGTVVRPAAWQDHYREKGEFHLGVMILLTMIPTGLIYVLFSDFFEASFSQPRLASGALLVTGVLLMLTVLRPNPDGPLTGGKSLLVGLAQAMAMIPGISRSGSTICTALYLNVSPVRAADFSFLMLIPVVFGATLLKVGEALSVASQANWTLMILGAAVAFVSGIFAIRIVLDFVRRGKLQYFAVYCFIVGGLGLILI
ncbi:MAG: undecaprenyl-diphosphate phosphatase [Rhodothermales bacterium]